MSREEGEYLHVRSRVLQILRTSRARNKKRNDLRVYSLLRSDQISSKKKGKRQKKEKKKTLQCRTLTALQ